MTSTAIRRTTESVTATEQLGAALGAALERGDLIVLDGELGAGKTCMVRGIAHGLGMEDGLVRSPTFVFHHVYPGPRLTLHHIDCYRLGPGADVGFLDLDDLLADGAVVVEWGSYAPLAGLGAARVHLECGAGDQRSVTLETENERLAGAWQ